jgi:nitrogenase subunit NifH
MYFDCYKPTVVCLCGSTRFMQAFQEANLRETLAGRIVLSVGCDTKSDEMLHITTEQKTMLDELHKHKIDLADEILVLNVGGYIGSSTTSEIAYARLHNKRIRWLEGCHECGHMQNLIVCDICGDRCCSDHYVSTSPVAFGNLFRDVERNILECFECSCK